MAYEPALSKYKAFMIEMIVDMKFWSLKKMSLKVSLK